jgi:Tol biopolymer transport system component
VTRAATLALCAACAVIAGDGSPTTAAQPRARLAFAHAGSIWLLSADGSHRRRVTRGRGDGSPAWSPDGSLIAFGRRAGETSSVWVAAPNGDGTHALVSDSSASYNDPAWSPDGSQLAVTRYEFGQSAFTSSIEVVGRDGTGRRTVVSLRSTESLDAVGSPAWTPDGRRIAFTRSTAGPELFRFDIHTVALDGRDDRMFMADAADGSWSRDGRRFGYADSRDKHGMECGSDECYPNGELAIADADGSNRTLLTHTIANESGATWSPDGTRIAFASGRNTPELPFSKLELYSIAPDGSCLTWLTNGSPDSAEPIWSPAGGDAAPRRCGAARRALVEVKPTRRLRGALWLGSRFGNALFSSSQFARGEVIYDYGDCGAFRPRQCTPPFLLSERGTCGRDRELAYVIPRLKQLRVVRGALVGVQDNDGRGVIVTGRLWIHVQPESGSTRRNRVRLYERIARALRAVGGRRRSSHARPVLPNASRKRLPARMRAVPKSCP